MIVSKNKRSLETIEVKMDEKSILAAVDFFIRAHVDAIGNPPPDRVLPGSPKFTISQEEDGGLLTIYEVVTHSSGERKESIAYDVMNI